MILILVILVSIVFFIREVFPIEVVALSATSFLLLMGIITPDQAVSGFSNKAVITIGAMFIMSKALLKTGFLEVVTEKVYQFAGKRKWITICFFCFAHVSTFFVLSSMYFSKSNL